MSENAFRKALREAQENAPTSEVAAEIQKLIDGGSHTSSTKDGGNGPPPKGP